MKQEYKYIEKLNDCLPERARIFKLSKVFIDGNYILNITLLVNSSDYDSKLNDELKKAVEKFSYSILPEEKTINIIYKKTITSEALIVSHLLRIIYDKHPIIAPQIHTEDINVSLGPSEVIVKLFLNKETKNFMIANSIHLSIAEELESQIMEEVKVIFGEDKNTDIFMPRKVVRGESESLNIRLISINQKKSLIGAISKSPIYISDIDKDDSQTKVVCGTVKDMRQGYAKKSGKLWITFSLDDSTSVVKCLMIPLKKHVDVISNEVKAGVSLVVEGKYSISSKNEKGEKIFFIDYIATCDIDYSSVHLEIPYKQVATNYIVIIPQDYIEEVQDDFFDNENEVSELLRGNIVVFDLETTGFNNAEDEIIEIGAVKLENGTLTKTFQTLINPGIHIPDEASKVNNIYDQDVLDAPSFKDVISDFYKFCFGCKLVAHNAPFDMGMISFHARKYSYKFDNQCIDTLGLARKTLKIKTGLKLEELKKRYNIETGTAHRGLSDALATAKLLKLLLKARK